MQEQTPPYTPGERINAHIETNEGVEVHRVDFIKLDETGLLAQQRNAGPIIFFPRERIVMLGGAR